MKPEFYTEGRENESRQSEQKSFGCLCFSSNFSFFQACVMIRYKEDRSFQACVIIRDEASNRGKE